MTKSKVIKSNNVENKTYSYQTDKVNLSFTLRSDTKEEMEDFLGLIELAKQDVTSQLNKLN